MPQSVHLPHLGVLLSLIVGQHQLLAQGGPPSVAQEVATEQSSAKEVRVRSTKKVVLLDRTRNQRIPLRITMPVDASMCPVIIWSHDTQGNQNQYGALIKHWAINGYVCIQPTHVKGLSPTNRAYDIAFIIAGLEKLMKRYEPLARTMDASRIGVGGHAAGAHTSQLVSGALMAPATVVTTKPTRDDRPLAFVLLSPLGESSKTMFGPDSWSEIDRPTLSITGSKDNISHDEDWRWRLAMFRKAPHKDKFMLFVADANSEFGGIIESGRENAKHAEYVKLGTLTFWNAYLKNNRVSKRFLASSTLEEKSSGEAYLIARSKKRPTVSTTTRIISRRNSSKKSIAIATISDYDKNGDGKLDRDEMPPQLVIGFDLIDINGDRSVSASELESGLQRLTITQIGN